MTTSIKTFVPMLLMLALLLVAFPGLSLAKKDACATIQGGTILDSAGESVGVGYDQWGYNYQAKMFNGYYDNFSRPEEPVMEGNSLQMKWNDAWLSNKDCDGDNELDRHYGYDSYIGSGAWLTNHEVGSYEDEEFGTCDYEYFVKIVAVPEAAELGEDDVWYAEDGSEIGPVIWGSFAITQEQTSDSCYPFEQYKGDHPGLGNWADEMEEEVVPE